MSIRGGGKYIEYYKKKIEGTASWKSDSLYSLLFMLHTRSPICSLPVCSMTFSTHFGPKIVSRHSLLYDRQRSINNWFWQVIISDNTQN